MIVKVKTDKLLPCYCGFKPDYYSIAYGRAPYAVFCPNCKRQLDGVGGASGAIIPWWNIVGRFSRGSLSLNGYQGAPPCTPDLFCSRGHSVEKKKQKTTSGELGWYCRQCDGIYVDVNDSKEERE